ncbi:RES family NAD+ phosphorylase [Chitinophaga sp.]|uniref:RES family NAD+ phosphorylase n=1 Tax=Chitinophaga sp. TaxID=1869181 RepID=UPI002621755D|nr:RES family NAD+ phosphorylase [uncultured Chitinophaga sp.]
MLLFRITHKKFSQELYASGIKGRWNGPGRKVIYCAESISLAFLENMIRRQGVGFNDDFKIMIIEVPDDLEITVINPGDLPAQWRDFKDYSHCQPLGNKWYDDADTAILKVPSAVLPESSNYVLNSQHPAFRRVRLIETTDLVPDERIEDILKKYPH